MSNEDALTKEERRTVESVRQNVLMLNTARENRMLKIVDRLAVALDGYRAGWEDLVKENERLVRGLMDRDLMD